ncbi:hypothetical protein [Butyricimonas sp. An62]|uniref:hypothetical protein n=1 Tax=Butyricimonas sp. An62 TaxID=1965649 RepID=UPI002353ADC7|nr:hypothetical protein [Butyricimonas sp. An62]
MKIIQQPDILSFAGNVNDFVIEDVAKSLVFKLSVDGMVIVDEVYVAEGGEVRVSMKDIVDCFLSISIPRADSDYIIQSLAVKKFKAEIEDSVIEFTVVKGGISNVAESSAVFLKTQWLTLQPQEKRIVMHQPEYLSYYAVVTGSVKMTVYFADGSANETLLALEAGNLYTVDVSYLKISSKFERAVGCYDVWIENESGQRLTYVQRYILSTSNSAANVYLFENTLGGIDSVVFSGDFTEKIQTEGTVTTVLEESTDSDIDLNFSCEQNTGFIPSIDYARWLRGFFVSKQRYHVSGALRRIYLRESENGFTKNSLNDFTFEFFYSKQTKYDVVTRNRDDLPLLLEFPEVDSIPFLAPRLAEFPIAVVADDLMLPVQYAFENAWRRISIAAITQAVSEGAIDKIDLSSYWKKTELVRDGLYLKFLDKYIRAKFADDSTLWDGNAFDDYLDQAVKRDSDVQFRSFKSASFKAGPLGAGVGMVNDDEFQTDKLLVRKIMFVLEMMVQRMRFQLGQSMLTPGGGFKITRVEVHDTFYRLFFNNDGGRIPNYFVTNDQGRVQNHDGGDQKYFWGLVIATGNDYIDLSREDKDGDGVPAVGDEVVQLGNRDNPDRQDALMLTAVNGEVGMITYFGIDSFDLSGKEGSWFGKHGGKKGAVIKGEVHITSGSTGLKELEEFNEVETGINDARQVANDALALASSIVEVTASSQVFKYGYGFTGTPVPATITLTAITPKIEPTSYQWQFLNGTGWVNIESATKKTLDVMPGDPVLFPSGTNVRSFRCVCNGDEGFTDVFTLAKLADGAAGQAGSSGYTVLLTNESHTVSCDASGNPLAGELEKATTRVVVYKGVSVASFTLQNLVSAGGSFALDGDSGLKCTGLSESSATCTFEVKVDSVVIKKVFGVTKAKTGATGKAGADGKGISSTVVTYQASTSGTTVPTGTWGATIPSVSANQYLWTRTIITYTDGTTSTSYSIGKMGANGATGAAGKGIKSTAVTYQASTSGTTVPTGTWGTAIPSVSANQYLWTRTIITYTDNTTSTSYSIGKMGANGEKGDKGDKGENGESLSGKMIYKDPTFKNGVNGVSVYNNSGNGTVTVTRIAKTSDVPSDSGYCLQVKTSGTASPGSGGVVQSIQSRPDAVFIQKIIAKLPVGYKLNTASNSMGSGYSDKWLTDTAGTGKYTTYLRKITCGSSGSFSSGGHVYVTGSPTPTSSAPLVWYIAYMSCFDQTVDGYEDIVNTAYSKVEAGINSLASGITIFAKKNDFDALGNRVSSAEASIKTNASNIELKVSKNGVVSAINASPESVKISASKIDLVGKVTFAMLDSSTQTKVNGKLDTTTFNTFKGTLKGLAYKDTVLQAMKDETIIEGGYIKTSLIRTDLILSAGAQIGNFKIGAVGGASGNWLTVSDGSMGVSGSQLFFNKSDRVVYVGSHPSEGTGGQPVLGYFNIGPTTPTLKSSEKCALYAASPRHSSYLIKSYALYAEVGDVRIVDGGFGGKTQGFNLSGSSAVIDCNFLIGALFAVQSNMKITIRPGFEGQMIKLLNYTTSSVTIVKNTDGAFVSRIPGQKCGLFYFDGQNWMGLIIGDFYIT